MQIHSIFESISGEAGGFPQGTWCTFIRLQGCSLQCRWCDTPEAQAKKAAPDLEMTIKDIVSQVGTKHVLITGGEPLLQRDETVGLILELLDYNHVIQVETNGHHDIPDIATDNLNWVVDYKTPSSRMQYQMFAFRDIGFIENKKFSGCGQGERLEGLNANHIKFVIGNLEDLTFSLDRMQELRGTGGKNLNFVLSPLNADKDMVVYILDGIKRRSPSLLDQIIFSIQLHKILKMP